MNDERQLRSATASVPLLPEIKLNWELDRLLRRLHWSPAPRPISVLGLLTCPVSRARHSIGGSTRWAPPRHQTLHCAVPILFPSVHPIAYHHHLFRLLHLLCLLLLPFLHLRRRHHRPRCHRRRRRLLLASFASNQDDHSRSVAEHTGRLIKTTCLHYFMRPLRQFGYHCGSVAPASPPSASLLFSGISFYFDAGPREMARPPENQAIAWAVVARRRNADKAGHQIFHVFLFFINNFFFTDTEVGWLPTCYLVHHNEIKRYLPLSDLLS